MREMIAELSGNPHGQTKTGLLAASKNFRQLDETTRRVLFHIDVKPAEFVLLN